MEKVEPFCSNCIHYYLSEIHKIVVCNNANFFKEITKKPNDYCPLHKFKN